MRTFIKKIDWLGDIDTGYGNGYVVIPNGHPLHGKHYDDIDVNVHGGLTFSESANNLEWDEIEEEDKDGWVVGFDTAHFGDNSQNWTLAHVQEETNDLENQLSQFN